MVNRQGLYAVRFFLGLFEAGLWPGMLVHLCYWYRPDELAPRVVYVTLLGCFSTVLSGVLAFAFNGVTTGGLSGWKWYVNLILPTEKESCAEFFQAYFDGGDCHCCTRLLYLFLFARL